MFSKVQLDTNKTRRALKTLQQRVGKQDGNRLDSGGEHVIAQPLILLGINTEWLFFPKYLLSRLSNVSCESSPETCWTILNISNKEVLASEKRLSHSEKMYRSHKRTSICNA